MADVFLLAAVAAVAASSRITIQSTNTESSRAWTRGKRLSAVRPVSVVRNLQSRDHFFAVAA